MSKYISIIFVAFGSMLVSASASELTETPQQLITQIAQGWHLIAVDKGDLNKDGIDDYVVVVEADVKSINYTPRISFPEAAPYVNLQIGHVTPSGDVDILYSEQEARELMVFFGQNDGSLNHVFSHSDWVERADYGGVYGDSFNGVWLEDGNVILSGYGGSMWRWSWDMKIRYEDEQWRIIGYESDSYHSATRAQTKVERNFIIDTAKTTQYDDGEIIEQKWEDIWMKTRIYLTDSRPNAKSEK